MTHICVSKLNIIGSDNGLLPGRRQAIIWTDAGILLIGSVGTNFNEILIVIHIFSCNKIHFKMSSGKWRPFCFGLNVLKWPTKISRHLECELGVVPQSGHVVKYFKDQSLSIETACLYIPDPLLPYTVLKGKHPESGGPRREITCWHEAEGSDAWCQQVISWLPPPDERVFSFYTVLTYGINNKWCQ